MTATKIKQLRNKRRCVSGKSRKTILCRFNLQSPKNVLILRGDDVAPIANANKSAGGERKCQNMPEKGKLSEIDVW